MYQIKQNPEDFIVNEISNVELRKKGRYSIYFLWKKEYTTEKAIEKIVKKINIPRKSIGYAGNKDKIAITTQYISIKNCNFKKLDLKDIRLELKGFSDSPISLGDLEENEFEIKVFSKEQPKKIKKIINYFGEQRFSKNNKEIGKAIIKKEFKKAIELILEGTGGYENRVKDYISKNPNDHIGALRKIPLKILTLYINSYQSFLFNRLAKENSNHKNNKKLLLIGFGSKIDDESKEILKKEGITQRDFIIRQVPELSSEGTERDLFVQVQDLEIKEIDKVDNNEKNKDKKEKKIFILKFRLKKGSYATEVIKQMFS